MDVSIEEKEQCVKTLAITVSKEEVEKEYKGLYEEYKNDIVIPGFRKGKFPRKLFERKYADTIKDDVKGRIKENYLKKALEENKIEPIVAPDVEESELKRGEDFAFNVTIELRPEFETPPLDKIALSKEDKQVTDEMIGQEVDFLRERRKSFTPKKGGKVEKGDKVAASLEIKVDNEVIDTQEDANMYAEEHGSFLGEVEKYPDAVIGKKKGDTVNLKTVLPPYFHLKEYQGKKAAVAVTVKGIEKKVLPDPEDTEFLSAFGCESLTEMKDKIREGIEKDIERAQNALLTQQIYDYFNEKADFELPPSLLKREIETRRHRMRSQLMQQKKSEEEIKKQIEESSEDFSTDAVKALKNFFILDKVASDNTIVVTEQEVDERIAGLAQQQHVTPADMKERLTQMGGIDSIRSDIKEEKTIQFIIGKAKVDVKKEAKKGAKKSAKGSSQKKKTAAGKKDTGTTKKKSSGSGKKKSTGEKDKKEKK
jgi:trigger factor